MLKFIYFKFNYKSLIFFLLNLINTIPIKYIFNLYNIFMFFIHFWWITTPGNRFPIFFFKQCSCGNYGTFKSSKCWYFPILGTILGRKYDFDKNMRKCVCLFSPGVVHQIWIKNTKNHKNVYWVHVSSLNVILFTIKG